MNNRIKNLGITKSTSEPIPSMNVAIDTNIMIKVVGIATISKIMICSPVLNIYDQEKKKSARPRETIQPIMCAFIDICEVQMAI